MPSLPENDVSHEICSKKSSTMSLPFRFKAGSAGVSSQTNTMSVGVHHHRSTTKTIQKPYKSRFTSKSALKDQVKGMLYCSQTAASANLN